MRNIHQRLLKRLEKTYPKAGVKPTEQDREYELYLKTLSTEELKALYNEKMAESANDPEVIANMERWSKMTYEELLNEYFQKLKAC
jgi:hypothetical protein